MHARSITCGIRVEGVGVDTGESDAGLWAYRYNVDLDTGALTHTQNGTIVTLPRTITSSVDPIENRYRMGTLNFEMVASDLVTRTFLRVGEGAAALAANLTDADTSLTLTTAGLGGQVVYIEEETILLGVDAGGGSYTGCTRGLWGSSAKAHTAGAIAYDHIPAWRGRRVEFYVYTPQDGLRQLWTGFVDAIATNDDHTTLTLQCRELFSGLSKKRVNRSPFDLRSTGLVGATQGITSDGAFAVEGWSLRGFVPYDREVAKPGVGSFPRTPWVSLAIGETPCLVPYTVQGGVWGVQLADAVSILDPDAALVFENDPRDLPIREFYLISKDLDARFGNVSATSGLPYPYHPLSAAFALLTSTDRTSEVIDPLFYDIHSTAWSTNAERWLDVIAWRDLIEATREIEIDQWYLGFDGAPVSLLDQIATMVQAYGFYFAPTQSGGLAPKILRIPSIEEFCEAQAQDVEAVSPKYGGKLKFDLGLGTAVDEIEVELGTTPWAEGNSLRVNLQGVSTRARDFVDGQKLSANLSTQYARRSRVYLDGDAGDAAFYSLLSRAVLSHLGVPTLAMRWRDPAFGSFDYDLGEYFSLGAGLPEDAVLVGPDGARVALPAVSEVDQVRFMGLLVERGLDIPTQAYEVKIMLMAYRTGIVRLRAPNAMVATSTPGSNTLIVPPESVTGHTTFDSLLFEPLDEIELWEFDGTKWADSEVRTIVSITDQEIVLDGWYAADPGQQDPPLMIRVASSSEYQNTAHAACTDRPWVYLADALGVIDLPGALTTEADVYG